MNLQNYAVRDQDLQTSVVRMITYVHMYIQYTCMYLNRHPCKRLQHIFKKFQSCNNTYMRRKLVFILEH